MDNKIIPLRAGNGDQSIIARWIAARNECLNFNVSSELKTRIKNDKHPNNGQAHPRAKQNKHEK